MTNTINFFDMKSKPRFLNYKIAIDDLDQSVKDWSRDSTQDGLLNINGIDVKEIVRTRFPDGLVTAASLFKLLCDEILMKLNLDISSDKATNLVIFLMSTLHQGACLHMMQTALCEEATKNGYAVSNVQAYVNIEVKNNAVYIQEDVRVNKFVNSNDPEIEIIALDKTMPVIFGSSVQKISVNKEAQVSHSLVNSSLTYGSEQAKNIIDKRSLLQKIQDIFKNLFNLNVKITRYDPKQDHIEERKGPGK